MYLGVMGYFFSNLKHGMNYYLVFFSLLSQVTGPYLYPPQRQIQTNK